MSIDTFLAWDRAGWETGRPAGLWKSHADAGACRARNSPGWWHWSWTAATMLILEQKPKPNNSWSPSEEAARRARFMTDMAEPSIWVPCRWIYWSICILAGWFPIYCTIGMVDAQISQKRLFKVIWEGVKHYHAIRFSGGRTIKSQHFFLAVSSAAAFDHGPYGGILEIGLPRNHPSGNRIFHYKPFFLGGTLIYGTPYMILLYIIPFYWLVENGIFLFLDYYHPQYIG